MSSELVYQFRELREQVGLLEGNSTIDAKNLYYILKQLVQSNLELAEVVETLL